MNILSTLAIYYPYYIFSLAILLFFISLIELFFPSKVFELWMKWIDSKFFRFQGIVYMIGGFPLTQIHHTIAGYIMFVMGIIVVLMGPFILFYPEKFLSIVKAEEELLHNDHKYLIWGDAVMKIIASFVLLFNTYRIIFNLP